MATTIGTIQLIATIDTSQYKRGADDINKANDSIEDSTNDVEKRGSRSLDRLAKVGLAAVATAAIAVGAVITKNIGGAIRRVDTLNAFPRVLQTLGATADDAQNATTRLSESLQGLPTSLSDGAAGVQKLVAAGLNVPRATDAFLALNNALIAGGADASDAQIAMDGLVRGISAGEIPTSTLQAILSRLPTVFAALERSSGKTRDELMKLYSANPQQLIDDLVKLNKDGGGGLASLEDQAREATSGIGTGFSNLDNAIQRGIGSIITAIGSANIANALGNIGRALEQGLNGFSRFIGYLNENQGVLRNVGIIITTILTPALIRLTALTVVAGVQALIAGGRMAAGWLLALGPIGLVIAAVSGATALIVTNLDTIGNVASFLWSNITSRATSAFNSIIRIFGGIAVFFTQRFNHAWQGIRSAFSGVAGFFTGIYNNIVNRFRSIGTTVGNAIGNAFKGVINTVLRGAVGIVNTFVDSINGAIGALNKVPGVNIGSLSKLPIPQLAEGGIVSSATLAVIGEGREPEAVIPLSKLDAMLSNDRGGKTEYNIGEINISSEVDGERWLRRLSGNQEIVSSGLVPQQSYM